MLVRRPQATNENCNYAFVAVVVKTSSIKIYRRWPPIFFLVILVISV